MALFGFLILAACLLVNVGASAQTPAAWFEYFPKPTVHERFASLMYRRFERPEQISSRRSFSTLKALVETLNNPALVKATDTVFVLTDVNTIAEMAKDGDSWRPFERLHLQITAPRIWGESVLVFAHAPFTPDAKVKAYVQGDSVVADMALERLGISAETASRPETNELVDSFNSDRTAIAVIIDQEPSRRVIEFIAKAKLPLQLLPADREPTGVIRSGGYVASLVPYASQHFYPQFDDKNVLRPKSVLVSTPTANPVDGPLPILLTNVERVKTPAALTAALGDSLQRVVGEAYLLSLFEYGLTRCSGANPSSQKPLTTAAEQQFNDVLLNSYFSDTNNPYTVLGLLGQLTFEGDRSDEARYRRDIFVSMLQDKFDGNDPKAAVEWMLSHPIRPHQRNMSLDSGLRQQFAGYADKSKYDAAKTALLIEQQALLKEASGTPDVERRCRNLTSVRSRLATLAAASIPIGCDKPQPSRGLWSAIDFEPFYYLAVTDAIMEQSACPAQRSNR
jgi:hypothetical protein